MSGEFKPELPSGDSLSLGTSCLIKSLRRGRELEALWWACNIEAGGFWRYLFRRLSIFAVEDVGLADPSAIVVVQACFSAYEANRKDSRGGPHGDFVALPVLLLARASKNREADDLLAALGELRKAGWAPDVPPEALDQHTEEGRALLAKDERERHWLTEASVIVPDHGYADWRLWVRRWAAANGHLDPDDVEQEAQRWADERRLRFGLPGYVPVPPGSAQLKIEREEKR